MVSFREKLANNLKKAGFSLVSLENEGCVRVKAIKNNIYHYAAFMQSQYEHLLIKGIVFRISSQ